MKRLGMGQCYELLERWFAIAFPRHIPQPIPRAWHPDPVARCLQPADRYEFATGRRRRTSEPEECELHWLKVVHNADREIRRADQVIPQRQIRRKLYAEGKFRAPAK